MRGFRDSNSSNNVNDGIMVIKLVVVVIIIIIAVVMLIVVVILGIVSIGVVIVMKLHGCLLQVFGRTTNIY